MYKPEFFERAIQSGPEVVVYMMIEEIGGFVWRMRHDMADGRIPTEHHAAIDADIQRAIPQQKELVRSTVRFGVEKPFDENDHPTDAYWKWYRWWNQWHKGMPDEDWRRIDAMIGFDMTQGQIEECRPKEPLCL